MSSAWACLKKKNENTSYSTVYEEGASLPEVLRRVSLALDLIWNVKSKILNECNTVLKSWSCTSFSSCFESQSHQYGHPWNMISINRCSLSNGPLSRKRNSSFPFGHLSGLCKPKTSIHNNLPTVWEAPASATGAYDIRWFLFVLRFKKVIESPGSVSSDQEKSSSICKNTTLGLWSC